MNISILKRKIRYWRFIASKPTGLPNQFLIGPNRLLLLTIAFNEASLIERQIQLLKKFLQDPFEHIVVDNSSDVSIRQSIYEICIANGVGYAGVPFANPYKENKSHAAAMHWAYFQLVKNSQARYFGFLDHDIFPFAPYSLKDKWVQGIYGRVMYSYSPSGYNEKVTKEIPYWSLWAGFCFFEKERVKGIFPWSFNFFSKHFEGGYYLDTGGGLWDSLYSKMPFPGDLASYKVKPYSNQKEGNQNQSFEILDFSWIHFVSLSNWRTISQFDKKRIALDNMLQVALNKT